MKSKYLSCTRTGGCLNSGLSCAAINMYRTLQRADGSVDTTVFKLQLGLIHSPDQGQM